MKSMLTATSILAMIGTVIATLTAITFCLGMGANAKPPEIRALKLWMLGSTFLGVAAINRYRHIPAASRPNGLGGGHQFRARGYYRRDLSYRVAQMTSPNPKEFRSEAHREFGI